MVIAQLTCGTVLRFPTRNISPSLGEPFPCRRHTYCVVDRIERDDQDLPPARTARRRPPRTQSELITYLNDCRAASTHRLRSEGFTLRLVHAAEMAGDVRVVDQNGATIVALIRQTSS